MNLCLFDPFLPQVSLFPRGVVTTLVPDHLSILYLDLMVLTDRAIHFYCHEKLTVPTNS